MLVYLIHVHEHDDVCNIGDQNACVRTPHFIADRTSPVGTRERTSAWYKRYVGSTRQNGYLPDARPIECNTF
jgi:hypothetical protein